MSSGKQVVLADGIVLHFARSQISSKLKLECEWERFGHKMRVVAHAATPLFPKQGYRQYDFFIDGISWNDFPTLNNIAPDTNRGTVPNLNESSAHFITPRKVADGKNRNNNKPGGFMKSKSSPDLMDP